MIGGEVQVPVQVSLMLPPLFARILTPAELTFAVEIALSEGEANAKLLALLESAIELRVAHKVGA